VVASIFVAALFLPLIFSFLKGKIVGRSQESKVGSESALELDEKLFSNSMTIGDLVNKDTDGDGVLDWEEGLWGTDPNKKDTDGDGVPDDLAIEKKKIAQGIDTEAARNKKEENMTETEKFARDLFATSAALSQAGLLNQKSIDKIGASIHEQIKNPVIRKVYLISDLKIIEDSSPAALSRYNTDFTTMEKKYPAPKGDNVFVILKKVTEKEDFSLLVKLDPMTKYLESLIMELLNIKVPKEISEIHLEFINALEVMFENLVDIRAGGKDPIIAIGAIEKYPQSIATFNLANDKLVKALNKGLNPEP
jgi:hypothetical protein